MQPGIKEILQRFRQRDDVEGNWSDDPDDPLIDETNRRYSALAMLLRARYLVDVDCWSEVRGRPIKPGTICDALAATPGREGGTRMSTASVCLHRLFEEHRALEDYQGGVPRWCKGCGDNAILAAMQRLCRDEGLKPEKTVFVSGIGCSSRLPHYMRTYGFHGIHGRALPIAEGIKMARPDLHVFVNTGDGDCCSIGAAHWIHAIRYNMNITVMLHDNHIYGLTKKQASPTSPLGTKSNTTPRGSYLDALNPLTVTLGVQNVSFVAQAVDWIPESLFQIVSAAFQHRGLSFVRILQRCPEFVGDDVRAVGPRPAEDADADARERAPHERGAAEDLSQPADARPVEHDRAREIASIGRPDPGRHPLPQSRGALLRGPAPRRRAAHGRRHPATLEREFDKFTVWPQ